MPSPPLRPGVSAACLLSASGKSSVVEVLGVLDLSALRVWLRLSLPLATGTPVFIRLSLPDGTEHTAAGEVLWSVRDPGKPGHFTGIRFTTPLTEAVLRLFVEMP